MKLIEYIKNNLSKQKIIIVTLIVLILIGIAAIFILLSDQEDGVTQQPFEPLPTPKINKVIEESVSLTLTESAKSTNLPNELPVYILGDSQISEGRIENISNQFDFDNEPFVNQDPLMGETIIYYSNQETLRIIPGRMIIDYKTNTVSSIEFNQLPDEQQLIEISFNFLEEKNFVEDTDQLELYKLRTVYADETGHFSKERTPNTILLTFVKKANNYPILAPSHETGEVTLSLNSNLEIKSVYIDDLPNFEQFESFRIKNINQIENEVNSASLQSLNEGFTETRILTANDIKNGTINDISIAYIQENRNNQTYLQPVFLLTGEVRLRDGKTVSGDFFIPAIRR